MRETTKKFMVWLMSQTTIVRYFVIALLFHLGLLAILASIKIVSFVPQIVASFTGGAPPPAPDTAPEDPFAAYRDFDYNGPSFEGKGGGTGQKGPGGVPTAAGTQASIIGSEARGDAPNVTEVIAVMSDAATAITRPAANPGGVGLESMVGLGQGSITSPGIQGPGGPWLGANRIGPMKSAAIAKYGASAATEKAVMAALRWLKQHQNANGSWQSQGGLPAGTALAILAFLGHGETTESAEFGATVQKGLEFLVSQVPENGDVTGNMYPQALVALALAEGYAMSSSPALKAPLERTTRVIIESQKAGKTNPKDRGGWRYSPNSNDSDLSVSGWMIMALKSAANAGVEVPSDVFPQAMQYVWNTYNTPGFSYTGAGHAPTMTAVGCLCAQFMGQGDDLRVQSALRYLRDQKVDWQNSQAGWVLYMWYYMTQAMFQGGQDFWPQWNNQIRDTMVKNQALDGHWPAPPKSKSEHGDPATVYTTALGALILETYYRYLPMYDVLKSQKAKPGAPPAGR